MVRKPVKESTFFVYVDTCVPVENGEGTSNGKISYIEAKEIARQKFIELLQKKEVLFHVEEE